ncbi:MAG: response regulator [Anaerolineae bacterium]|nr:response regulator [Anaerolineae bacterium]NUQ06592.1 response regulator [Anaerolineae bacterium]
MNKLQGKHIFIVEDNAQNRVVYQIMFLRQGAVIDFDRWGSDTIHKLKNLPEVDVIIMDLMLAGGVTGFGIMEQIQQQEKLSRVPVVAVSAVDPATAILRCQDAGFAGFIAKPIDADRFPDLIARIIAGERVWLTNSLNYETTAL